MFQPVNNNSSHQEARLEPSSINAVLLSGREYVHLQEADQSRGCCGIIGRVVKGFFRGIGNLFRRLLCCRRNTPPPPVQNINQPIVNQPRRPLVTQIPHPPATVQHIRPHFPTNATPAEETLYRRDYPTLVQELGIHRAVQLMQERNMTPGRIAELEQTLSLLGSSALPNAERTECLNRYQQFLRDLFPHYTNPSAHVPGIGILSMACVDAAAGLMIDPERKGLRPPLFRRPEAIPEEELNRAQVNDLLTLFNELFPAQTLQPLVSEIEQFIARDEALLQTTASLQERDTIDRRLNNSRQRLENERLFPQNFRTYVDFINQEHDDAGYGESIRLGAKMFVALLRRQEIPEADKQGALRGLIEQAFQGRDFMVCDPIKLEGLYQQTDNLEQALSATLSEQGQTSVENNDALFHQYIGWRATALEQMLINRYAGGRHANFLNGLRTEFGDEFGLKHSPAEDHYTIFNVPEQEARSFLESNITPALYLQIAYNQLKTRMPLVNSFFAHTPRSDLLDETQFEPYMDHYFGTYNDSTGRSRPRPLPPGIAFMFTDLGFLRPAPGTPLFVAEQPV